MRRAVQVAAIALAVSAFACGDDGTKAKGLLWEDVYDAGGAVAGAEDVATGLAVCDGRVFVIGETTTGDDEATQDVLVRAYNARDGELLWQDRVDSAVSDHARSVVCDEGHTYVLMLLGYASVLRAYDAGNGSIQWVLEEPNTSPNSYGSVLVDENLVFRYEPSATTDESFSSAVLTAVDARSGETIWEHRATTDEPDESNRWGSGGITSSRDRVCAGREDSEAQIRRVQCFDRRSGALLWQDTLSRTVQNSSVAPSFAADGTILVAFGGEVGRTFLRAYAAANGASLWERDYLPYAAIGPMAFEDRILVSGVEFIIGEGPHDETPAALAEALDPRTGESIWRDRREGHYADMSTLSGASLILSNVDWVSLIYDADTGVLLGQQGFEASGGLYDLDGEDGRLFMVGSDFAQDSNFVVRAFAAP